MLKRIESFLRRIFSDELHIRVERLETLFQEDQQRFRVALCDAVASTITQLNAGLRDTITADLKQFRADCVAERLLVHAPQHWKADEETSKADHQLRHPRHKR